MSTNIKLPGMNTFPLENHFQICSFNITTQKKQRYFKPLIFANVSLILPCSVARPSHLVSPHANFLLYLVLPPTSWTILSPTSLYFLGGRLVACGPYMAPTPILCGLHVTPTFAFYLCSDCSIACLPFSLHPKHPSKSSCAPWFPLPTSAS